MVKADGSAKTFVVDVITQGNETIKNVSTAANGDRILTTGGGVMSASLKTTGEKRVTFEVELGSGETAASLNVVARLEEDPVGAFRDRLIVVGAPGTTYPSFAGITVMNEAPVQWSWDRQLALTDGVVDSGRYEVRISSEGMDGSGLVETVASFNLKTPFKVKWGRESGDLSETPAELTTIMSTDGQDVAQVWVAPNKTVKVSAVVKSAAGQLARSRS